MSLLFKRALATVAETAPKVVDVLIVGGGPAGLTLTTALKNSQVTKHLNVSLIEGFNLQPVKDFYENTPEGFTNRISSLTPQSIEYLQAIGSWDFIKPERIQPYDAIVVTEGLSDARLNFDSNELATMCENVNLQSSLYQRIKDLESQSSALSSSSEFGLDIIDNTRVDKITKDEKDQWPIVHLSNGDLIKTRLLVGADGFNSPVRKFAGIESRGWFYERFGVVATLKLEDIPFRSTGWQRFLPNGPIALLPLPNDHATLVWAQSIELSKLLTEIDEELFKELINAAFILDDADMNYYYKSIKKNETEGLIDDIRWRISLKHKKLSEEEIEDKFPLQVVSIDANSRARFPLRLSHADTYVGERVALVGDAAHTTHPLAGQGLNMGQGDVQALVNALEKGIQRGLDIGNPLVLEPYWADRFPENNMLLGVVDKLHKLYSSTAEPVVALRTVGLNLVNELTVLKDLMIKHVSGK
jgi:ubiquinone biosynthesis monooxygenase Coq6